MTTLALIQAVKALSPQGIHTAYPKASSNAVLVLPTKVDAYTLKTALTQDNVLECFQTPISHTYRTAVAVYRPALATVLFAHFQHLAQMSGKAPEDLQKRQLDLQNTILALAKHKAPLMAVDGNNRTLLHHVAQHYDSPELVDALMACGVDPQTQSFFVEHTALDEAIAHGHHRIAERLKRVSGGMVRLHHADQSGCPLLRNTEQGGHCTS